MKNKLTCALALLACSTFANADWVGSVNYNYFSDGIGSEDVDLGAIGITAGYRFDISDNFRLVPELRIGTGFGDDSIAPNVDIEIDDYFGAALRGEYVASEDVYLFAVISNQNIGFSVDGVINASDSETEFGYGAGAGWQINEHNAVEISYEDIDDVDLITVGYRFSF